MRECATDRSGLPPEWLACRPPQGGVLMAATMSWSMLWHHCSTTDDEACGGGGLLSSWCATTSVPSVAVAGGSVTVVVAVHWCCVASVVGHSRHGSGAATPSPGSSHPRAGSGFDISPLLFARGVREGSHGMDVHHGVEAGAPRINKSPPPLPGAPNIEVVLRHFHRSNY
jgi:hypothetical protein